jgi:putative flippase GtrA
MTTHVAWGSASSELEPFGARSQAVALDIVIPVYNEERELAPSVATVREHLLTMPFTFRITIADNASTDATNLIARQLAHTYDEVRVTQLDQKGRGRALKHAWLRSDAAILVYMDVDLSTDLNALLPLIAPLLSGHSDLAIGTRLARNSRTLRGPKREFISRGYNYLLRGALRARFSDAQCGFKAIRNDVAKTLLPLIKDDEWFFDTELLIVAERSGLRIHEVPVDWADDPDSRVDIVATALADLRGMARLGAALVRGRVPLGEVRHTLGRASETGGSGVLSAQVALFVLVGIVSTLVYGVIYVMLRGPFDPMAANATALVLTTLANTAANRRLTFGVKGTEGAMRHQMQGLMVFAAGLAITSGSLWVLDRTTSTRHRLIEVVVLTAANLAVTVLRFVLMRTWIFTVGRRADTQAPTD